MDIIYEDNHILVVNKQSGEIVQGDKTGDIPMVEALKEVLKEKYNKPGNVFCGVVHRLDRPVSGLVIFAKTSKALSRLNNMIKNGEIHKKYRALIEKKVSPNNGKLEGYIISNSKQNKSYIYDNPGEGRKFCALEYETIKEGENYSLVDINLLTGKKHQIRALFSYKGNPIKGDLKYGAKRSNPNGGISLQAYKLSFIHPVSKEKMEFTIPPLQEFIPFL